MPEKPDVRAVRIQRMNEMADPGPTALGFQPRLNEVDQDVLYGISLGLTNAQIAHAMHLSEDWVKSRVREIANSFGSHIRVRAALVRLGFELEYLQPRAGKE